MNTLSSDRFDLNNPADKNLWMNLRNFLMVATHKELETEIKISIDAGDLKRASMIEMLRREWFPREMTS